MAGLADLGVEEAAQLPRPDAGVLHGEPEPDEDRGDDGEHHLGERDEFAVMVTASSPSVYADGSCSDTESHISTVSHCITQEVCARREHPGSMPGARPVI